MGKKCKRLRFNPLKSKYIRIKSLKNIKNSKLY